MLACLEALRWSQKELERTLGVTQRTVARWAAGQMTIPPPVADWLRASSAALRAQPLPEGW